MKLEQRLAKLETARGGNSGGPARDAEAFVARLDSLVGAVKAQGDFGHRAGSAPAENFCRACLRGDDAAAAAILGEAIGGRP